MIYNFGSVIGNGQIITNMRRSVLEGRLSHSYLIEGAEGAGKFLLASCFAKFIFCETKSNSCSCHSCVQYDAGSHSDLIVVDKADKKSIGVEQIRASVINQVHKKPFEYDYKIFIIKNAQLMTPEAQNALLRSIEEPPDYGIFILLTSNISSLLQTVLSRCFIYNIRPFANSAVLGYLEKAGVSGEQAGAAAAYSGGSIGKGLQLSESEVFFDMRERLNRLFISLPESGDGLWEVLSNISGLEEFKAYPDYFVSIALIWFRDVLAYKATGSEEYLFQRDYTEQIAQCARRISFKRLYIGVSSLLELKRSLKANTAYNAALEAFAIKISSVEA